MRVLDRVIVVTAAGPMAWAASGCLGPKGVVATPTDAASPAAPAGAASAWRHPFLAEAVSVHPLTRFNTDPKTGAAQIELHVEFFDAYGHPVKALGVLTAELRRQPDAAGGSEQVTLWRVDLGTPERHERAYDRITRTYRLLLRDIPPGVERMGPMTMSVRFRVLDAQGERLLDTERPIGG